ncbi:hypothetical protein SPRG_04344 [Saprolegnia parasitica CBS 223.65]|uniref:Uncharacterized protein n=1 Tax=Saprolegnia parasitica (strain CBS 223.65) TaxID=695850 RepID=A0A067CUH1_SAPPC|nr:hypothetical protein SPRG_04344 [Saprolegnia parasitica CBS 223.65]KDO30442.1 hypothetical protein SPRG_04344 [Saprolegnia parasitica CBS 223.65]|eukprot:XP_012198664.1 hypothetical protein SPRG_04344 [Saprolegnia parasitica CBS 223.65]
MWHLPSLPEPMLAAPRTLLDADSFDEEFKTLFKQTLQKPTSSYVDVFAYDDDITTTGPASPVAADDIDCFFFSTYSQPIEIDYRRRRTCSMESYEDRDLRLRRRVAYEDDDDEDTLLPSSKATRALDDDADDIFLLEL